MRSGISWGQEGRSILLTRCPSAAASVSTRTVNNAGWTLSFALFLKRCPPSHSWACRKVSAGWWITAPGWCCARGPRVVASPRHLIDTREEHVLTIENPIEFVFKENAAIVNQRQVGDHTSSFARALRAALREDPDVIAITELRDKESIGLALSAAETGHLVLGTLHTGNAGQTISRIVNTFAAEEQGHIRTMLSESLRAVVSQRLVPKADGTGRALAWELLMCNNAVANMIRDDKMFQISSIMQTGRSLGMTILDDSLWDLVTRGVVTKDEARRFAENKDRFR